MSTSNTIDTAMAKRMVDASAIRGASIIGQPGGWSVVWKLGLQERPLGAQRTDRPRTWRSLDRAVAFVKNELHIARFDLLDASNHSAGEPVAGSSPVAAAERLRNAHKAAAYDKWFRAEVEQGIKEADDPNTQWVSNDEVKAPSVGRHGPRRKHRACRPSVSKRRYSMEDAQKLARVNFQVSEEELERLKIYAAKNKKTIREIMVEFIRTLPN